MTKQIIKQPVVTDTTAITAPPEGTCSQEDFDHLRNKGFVVSNASHNGISFTKRCPQFNNSVMNIRFENGSWTGAVFRSWDTKNKDYDATFTPKYQSLQDLLTKTREDLVARAELMKSLV